MPKNKQHKGSSAPTPGPTGKIGPGPGPGPASKPKRRVITDGAISSGRTTVTVEDRATGYPTVRPVNYILIREPDGTETLFLMELSSFQAFLEQGMKGLGHIQGGLKQNDGSN